MHRAAAAILARVAWQTLRPAADRGDPNAIEAIWQAWLRRPDDKRWELLSRWRGAQPLTEAVFAAAVDPARPAAARAALGAFCARHGLAPGEPPARARFYLLTGQPGQHHADDPDGSALAAAYYAGDERVRAALRQVMADSGGLDLIRVIAARGGDAARTADSGQDGEAERAYLAAEFARRQDWPQLWRLALDLPLAEAIAAARLLPAGWRAPNEAGQWLLARLAAASLAEVTALATPPVTRLDAGKALCEDCKFAPDGSEVAVAWWKPDSRRALRPAATGVSVTVHALPGGRRLETLRDVIRWPSRYTVHLRDATVLAQKTDPREYFLVRHVPGHGIDELAPVEGRPWGDRTTVLAPARDGFVFVAAGRLLHGTAKPGSPLRDITPPGLDADGDGAAITLAAGEPATGRLAVVTKRARHRPARLAVLGPDHEIIGGADVPGDGDPGIEQIAFCGPSRLISCDNETGRVRSWRVDPAIAEEASTVFHGTFPSRLLPLPRTGLILIESLTERGAQRSLYQRHVRNYLDARTLEPAACPAALGWTMRDNGTYDASEWLCLSPDGELAALARTPRTADYSWVNEVEVRDLVREEIAELVRRPLARSRPADLAAVAGLAGGARGAGALAVLGLLRECLEHRFGADVALGQSRGRPGAAPDDIAL